MTLNMLRVKSIKIILFAVCAVSIYSCRPGMSRSGSGSSGAKADFFTSFYINTGQTKYYIKPFRFTDDKEVLMADITYSISADTVQNGTFNFSVFSKSKIPSKSIKKLFLNNNEINDFSVLYNEPLKSKYELRITSEIPAIILKGLKQEIIIKLETDDRTYTFVPDSKSKKVLYKLSEMLK